MRRYAASAAAVLSGFGFLAVAGLHATGYSGVSDLASRGPAPLRPLVPALWIAFSSDLVVLGCIVLAVAWRPTKLSIRVLALAGFAPAIAAGLQIVYLGFIPPTGILLALALLTWAAAIAMKYGTVPETGGRIDS